MKSYNFGSLDGVGIDLICNVFGKMLSAEMERVGHFKFNNYEWCVGVNVVRRINDINRRFPLPIETGPNSILGIDVIKSYAVEPNAIVLRIKPIEERALDRLKNKLNNVYGDSLDALRYATEAAKFLNFGIEKKEDNIMPTNYYTFTGAGNLYFRFKEEIKDVIFNNPATIILWSDGTKTVVKCEGENYDPEKGLAMAIAKYYLGTNKSKSDYYDIFNKWLPKEPVVEESKNDINYVSIEPNNPITHYETVKEFAKKAGASESTIRKNIRDGKFPGAFKQDGLWLIPCKGSLKYDN